MSRSKNRIKGIVFTMCALFAVSMHAAGILLKVDSAPENWLLKGKDLLKIRFYGKLINLTDETQAVSLYYWPRVFLSRAGITVSSGLSADTMGALTSQALVRIKPHGSTSFSYSAILRRDGDRRRLSGDNPISGTG